MTPEHDILQVTPRVEALAALCRSNSRIDPALYRKYDVKRGLRDINGQGVLGRSDQHFGHYLPQEDRRRNRAL